MKKCSKCKIEKELTEFYKDKAKKDGLRSDCKSCQKASHKAYREANKEKIKAKKKAYREANKDKIKAYYEANKDKIKAQIKAYRESNKDKIKAYRGTYKDKRNAVKYLYKNQPRFTWYRFGDKNKPYFWEPFDENPRIKHVKKLLSLIEKELNIT